jgi:hypothetical protein
MTMKIDLSGPMRGYPDNNHHEFNIAEENLQGYGYEVFNPAKIDKTDMNIRQKMSACLKYILEEADAVVLLPGWRESFGARAEVLAAQSVGIPVYELSGFLIDTDRTEIKFTWEP